MTEADATVKRRRGPIEGANAPKAPPPKPQPPVLAAPPADLTPVKVLLTELVPNPRNPRRHPQNQLEMVRASLIRFGQRRPIMARAANKMIVVGHGLWEAARMAGMTHLYVLFWDIDQATADAYMVADNRLGDLSSHDPDLLGALLRDMEEDDLFAAGFDEKALEAAFGDFKPLGIEEVDASLVSDRFWISIKGDLADQPRVLDRVKVLLAEWPTVEVELGTVSMS